MARSSDKNPRARDESGSAGKSPTRPDALGSRSTDASTPSLTGHFLIAMPGLGDPNFARGITFICQHNQDGAMGLVVNRLSDYRLGDVLKQMRMPCDSRTVAAAPVLAGGPVQPERGFVLHAGSNREWESSYHVDENLTVTTSRDILAAMADGEGPPRVLVALGYAGWGAGQLEQELRENAWLTVQADSHILFDTALDERWGAAVALVGVNPANLTSYSGRA